MTAKEINGLLQDGKEVHIERESTRDRRKVYKARTSYGRVQVQTRTGNWIGVGGNYCLKIEGLDFT